MNAIGVKTLAELGDLYKKYDVIAIDEGQFMSDVSQHFLTCAIDRKLE